MPKRGRDAHTILRTLATVVTALVPQQPRLRCRVCIINAADNNNFLNDSANGLPKEWVLDKKGAVAVMLCGNLMRPGGACMVWKNGKWQFVLKPSATTQEEAVLSWLASLGKPYDKQIIKGLTNRETLKHMALPPVGDDTDFKVMSPTGLVDVQEAEEGLYEQVLYSFFVGRKNGSGVYLVAVAGPNAKHPGDSWPDPRPPKKRKLDTVYRTASYVAIHNYNVFRACVANAVKAFLVATHQRGVKRAIISPVSCGLYSGCHQPMIQKQFHEICLKVLDELEKQKVYFDMVVIPKFP